MKPCNCSETAPVTVAALITFSVLLNHGVKHVPLSALLRPTDGAADSRSSAFSPPAQQAATYNGEEGTISSAARRQPRMATNPSLQTNAMARNFQMDAPPLPESAEPVQQQSRGAASSLHAEVKLDATERHHVVEAAATILDWAEVGVEPDVKLGKPSIMPVPRFTTTHCDLLNSRTLVHLLRNRNADRAGSGAGRSPGW